MKNFGLNLLLISSIFWVTSLPISPIYFFCFFGFLVVLIFSKLSKITFTFNAYFLILLYIVYLLSTQLYLKAKISPLFNQIFSLSYFILIYFSFYHSSVLQIKRISINFLTLSLPLLIFEAFYRITNPIYNAGNNIDYRDTDSPFYAYKLNSILNQDSNYVSVLILILFFYSVFLYKYYKNWLPFLQITFSILLLLTISRAAILILFLILFYLFTRHLLKLKLLKMTLLLILTIFLYKFFQFAMEDLSTQIKIASIIKSFSQIVDGSTVTKLIGVGIGNSADKLGGVSAHNIIEALILEQGILGFLFFFMVQIKIDQLSNGSTRIIMIPFLLVSMSFFVYAITYYYAILALICLIYNKRNYFEKI